MRQAAKQQKNRQRPFLYHLVFEERYIQWLVIFLFGFFVLHPTTPAFAADDVSAETQAESAEVTIDVDEPDEEVVEDETEEKIEVAEEEPTEEYITEEVEIEDLADSDESEVLQLGENETVSVADNPNDTFVTETEESAAVTSEAQPSADEDSVAEIDHSSVLATDGLETSNEDQVLENSEVTATTTEEVTSSEVLASTTDAKKDVKTVAVDGGTQSSGAIVETDYSATTTATSSASTTNAVHNVTEGSDVVDEVNPLTPVVDETAVELEVDTTDSDETTNTVSSSTPLIDNTASGTEKKAETNVPLIVHNQTSDDPLHFSSQDCTAVGDGSFYCEKQGAVLPTYEDDEIFVAPDEDGDKEIYVRLRGEVTQITHNLVDDAAPKFDPLGNYMTWHRLVDDRYQVILYNLETGQETQVTEGVSNNMQPDVFDGELVWQAWDGNDWEIHYYNGEIIQPLTNNELPDLSPNLNDSFVVWNTVHEGNEKAAVVYDRTSGQIELLEESDSVMVRNPRMILMYEAEFENGDIVTRGFDIETGRIIPLTASPQELPEQIPEPDQTGETRALISSKTNAREGEETNEIDVVTKPVATTSVTTTNEGGDIIISSHNVSTSSAEVSATSSSDVVITPLPASEAVASSSLSNTETATSTEHIPDIVIPLSTATNTVEVG